MEGGDGVVEVTLSGELDLAAAPSVRDILNRAVGSGVGTVRVDV